VARHLYHDAMIAAHTGTHYASLYDMNKAKEIIAISFFGAGGFILGNFASALGLLLPILGSHKISISTSHMIYLITWACSISYLWIAHCLWFNRTFPRGTTNRMSE
jgi:cytochrome oxidase assembly protein ShyY1